MEIIPLRKIYVKSPYPQYKRYNITYYYVLLRYIFEHFNQRKI